MHSPINDQMFWPTAIAGFEPEVRQIVIQYSLAYLIMSIIVFGYGFVMKGSYSEINTDEEFEKLAQ